MDYVRELRNIRITLIVLTIVVIFAIGNTNQSDVQDVNVDIPEGVTVNSDYESDSSLINLGDGNFGVYNSYSDDFGGPSLKIYHYDEKANKLILRTEQAIDTEE